jgi:outer membrane biosynthesis protein TonB
MRVSILVGAMILTCTAAHAGPTRNLSLAADEPAQTAEQPAPEQPKPQVPATVERPKLVPEEQVKVPPTPVQRPAAAEKPRRKHESTEARVIFELHRHGIYW